MPYNYHDRINTHIMVNITTNLESTFYEDKEIQVIIKNSIK